MQKYSRFLKEKQLSAKRNPQRIVNKSKNRGLFVESQFYRGVFVAVFCLAVAVA